jgi:exodeoxyribonuclease III
MKIATFNVNSVRARIPILVKWIGDHQPDVLALQETKVQDIEFPADEFTSLGYQCYFSGQKAYNGVAFLSKIQALNVRSGFHPDDKSEAPRLIRGDFNGVHIINTYVPQGREVGTDHYAYKLNWFKNLKQLFETECRPDQNVIWLGDLNVAPEPIDVYDPVELEGHVCFNPGLSEVFKDVCSWGFFDVLRRHHPEPQQYTFFDYRMFGSVSKKLGWRIDHILATRPMLDRCVNSWIDLEPRKSKEHKTSDHTVLVAEFRS